MIQALDDEHRHDVLLKLFVRQAAETDAAISIADALKSPFPNDAPAAQEGPASPSGRGRGTGRPRGRPRKSSTAAAPPPQQVTVRFCSA